MDLHVDFVSLHADAFCLKQPSLQGAVRLGNEQPSPSSHHPVPRNSAAARACGHSVAHGARSTRQAEGACQFSISCNPPARDFLYQPINRIPRHVFLQLSWKKLRSGSGLCIRTETHASNPASKYIGAIEKGAASPSNLSISWYAVPGLQERHSRFLGSSVVITDSMQPSRVVRIVPLTE